jgi:hypothetical protein
MVSTGWRWSGRWCGRWSGRWRRRCRRWSRPCRWRCGCGHIFTSWGQKHTHYTMQLNKQVGKISQVTLDKTIN